MAIVNRKTLLGLAAVLAASPLAAQDPEALFAEGLRALRLGNREEAIAKLQQVLAADPSHEQAFQIWRQTDRDMWRWLMLEQGDIQKIARELSERARMGRKEMSRDESAIDALVDAATDPSGDYGSRRSATNQLIAEHGEFAVPALVAKLGGDDTKVQDFAILALYGLGTVATLPLMESLNSDSEQVQRNVAAALRHIGDPRSAGALAALAQSNAGEDVRYTARAALQAMGSSGANAAGSLSELAESYLAGRQPVTSSVVWSFHDGALKAIDVPESQWSLRVAQKLAHAAFRADPASAGPRSLYARTLLAEAAAIDASQRASGEEDADASARASQLRVKALALGPDIVRGALAEARAAGMSPVAVEAARLLGKLEVGRVGNDSELVAALSDNDKRVAYAAALALVAATGGGDVPASDKVVEVLGRAVGEETLRTILVVDGNEVARRTAREALSSGRGTVVEAAARGTAAVGSLMSFPAVDVVVINQDLPDVVPENVISVVRHDPRMKNTKIIVVASSADAASERFGDRVDGIIEGPISGEALTQKVNEVLEGVEMDANRKWGDSIAARASSAIAAMAAKGASLGGTSATLAAQLDRSDDIAIPAAHALARGGAASDVPAVLGAISGSGSNELKAAAAEALGAILQRAGTVPEGVLDVVTAALSSADGELRNALVSALGRMRLSPGERLKLMDTLDGSSDQ